jgi:sialic acid synthase SpsE
MVNNIRRTESSMGKDRLISGVYECEIERITNARRALYWSRDAKIGDLIDDSLIIAKRPGKGVSPIYYDDIVGNYLSENVKENSNVNFSQIKK